MTEKKCYINRPQLIIKKVGKIVTFKDKATGNRYYILNKDLRAILYGGKKYNYANEYIPYKTVKMLFNINIKN